MTILLVVQKDRCVMSLHLVGNDFYKRVYDTELEAEVDFRKRKMLEPLPKFGEV